MATESPREASWSHLRAQARKVPQRAPERPPGAISEPRPENASLAPLMSRVEVFAPLMSRVE
eukprot:2298268-Karenia_brevis.AAC.1